MHAEEFAILKGLVPVAWADGSFADKEREMLSALLDAYRATDQEREELFAFANTRRTLDDVPLQDLSSGDRRVLLQTAVLLSFVDGEQHADEEKMLKELAAKLRINADEAEGVIASAAARARKNLVLLK